MTIKGTILAMAAASMLAVNNFAPPMGGSPRPSFTDRAPEYDGLGRKKRIVPPAPKMRSRDNAHWRDFAARVEATHSHNHDPRPDHYLHSHARRQRAAARKAAA
jgi:hypothetical protein